MLPSLIASMICLSTIEGAMPSRRAGEKAFLGYRKPVLVEIAEVHPPAEAGERVREALRRMPERDRDHIPGTGPGPWRSTMLGGVRTAEPCGRRPL